MVAVHGGGSGRGDYRLGAAGTEVREDGGSHLTLSILRIVNLHRSNRMACGFCEMCETNGTQTALCGASYDSQTLPPSSATTLVLVRVLAMARISGVEHGVLASLPSIPVRNRCSDRCR